MNQRVKLFSNVINKHFLQQFSLKIEWLEDKHKFLMPPRKHRI